MAAVAICARRCAVLLPVVGVMVVLRAAPAVAYRPFISTDAAVAERRELEIELGYLGLDRTSRGTVYTVPNLVLNYGVVDDVELVGQFLLQEQAGEDLQVVEPELSLKTVLKDGVLQEQPGVSVAVETSLLLPSTLEGEGRVGFEAVGIVSGRLSRLTSHLNLGGGVDRRASNPLVLWGLISALPIDPQLRLVNEINGESAEGAAAKNSGLLGAIWQPFESDVAFDVGVRKGFSRAVPDWGITVGLTFAWAPFASAGEEGPSRTSAGL